MRQGQDFTACPLYSAYPQVLWAQRNDGEEVGRENFPEALGREGCIPQTRVHMKFLSIHMVGTVRQTSSTCHMSYSHMPASIRPFCSQLDHCLQEVSPCYKSLRFRGSVGPARVHLVGQGAFRELREALAACPSSCFPPEMPRVLRHRHLARLLQSRVLS